MLSFFSKKKPNPDSPEEAIQGPADPQSDDFIFVDKKPTEEPPAPISMYPPMPQPPGFGIGAGTHFAGINSTPLSYIHGVPFELAPQLCTKSEFEMTQLQVDGILAWMTRQMSVEEQDEYNFRLERSIQNECY